MIYRKKTHKNSHQKFNNNSFWGERGWKHVVLLIFVIFRIFSNENMFQTKTKINYFPVDNSVTRRWKEKKKSMV